MLQEKYKQFLKYKESQEPNSDINDKILLIDGTNMFIRSFSIVPEMNDHGDHIGGLTGSLRSLGYVIRTIKPTKCIIIFDGHGGSNRRKKLFPAYKESRNIATRLNRAHDWVDKEKELESFKYQMSRLVDYFDTLPVQYFIIDQVEADDVISYIAAEYFQDKKVVITSTDKDFLQLVNENIQIWNPATKKLITEDVMLKEYQFNPKNFIWFKAITGDNSDNIPGVKGIGLKTIQKKLGILKEDKMVSRNELFKYCADSGEKILEKIVEEKDKLILNYRLMDLSKSNDNVSEGTKLKIYNAVTEFQASALNKKEFLKLLREDTATNLVKDVIGWLNNSFSYLNKFING